MAALSSTATPATRNALETSVICPVCVYNGVCGGRVSGKWLWWWLCEAQSDAKKVIAESRNRHDEAREMSFLPFGISPGWQNYMKRENHCPFQPSHIITTNGMLQAKGRDAVATPRPPAPPATTRRRSKEQ
jgi:hypothetical protein